MSSSKSSREQTRRAALALVERGLLSEAAARAITFYGEHGLFCEVMQVQGDRAPSIICRERWYSLPAFNALIADGYTPTAGDIGAAIACMQDDGQDGQDGQAGATAASTASATASSVALIEPPSASGEPGEPVEPVEPVEPAASDDHRIWRDMPPDDDAVWQQLRESYARPEGEGVLVWGLASFMGAALFIAVMLWGWFHQVR